MDMSNEINKNVVDNRSNIIITDEFKKAIKLFNEDKNLFITGVAGTGKSTLLSIFKANAGKNIVILAPTGIAALNIGGSTIHSFFYFPTRLLDEDTCAKSIRFDKRRHGLFKNLSTIIIDEISMVRADILDAIDYSLKVNRKNLLPFGGVQMVFFGDILQLPPVVTGKELYQYFDDVYGGSYFFNAKSFSISDYKCVQLTRIFRQKDEGFRNLLNKVRYGNINNEILERINSRFSANKDFTDDTCITLCSTNKIANEINDYRLSLLKTPVFEYEAEITGKFEQATFPTDSLLTLKVGTQVMMVKNSPLQYWVNGSIGKILSLSEDEIYVEIDGREYNVGKAKWEIIEYNYNKEINKIESEVVGTFIQYPVKLAWAITIHKSQGKTFNNICIDLGRGAFSHGQTYVALSRCTSLEGITLRKKIENRDIIVDSRVTDFIENQLKNTLS